MKNTLIYLAQMALIIECAGSLPSQNPLPDTITCTSPSGRVVSLDWLKQCYLGQIGLGLGFFSRDLGFFVVARSEDPETDLRFSELKKLLKQNPDAAISLLPRQKELYERIILTHPKLAEIFEKTPNAATLRCFGEYTGNIPFDKLCAGYLGDYGVARTMFYLPDLGLFDLFLSVSPEVLTFEKIKDLIARNVKTCFKCSDICLSPSVQMDLAHSDARLGPSVLRDPSLWMKEHLKRFEIYVSFRKYSMPIKTLSEFAQDSSGPARFCLLGRDDDQDEPVIVFDIDTDPRVYSLFDPSSEIYVHVFRALWTKILDFEKAFAERVTVVQLSGEEKSMTLEELEKDWGTAHRILDQNHEELSLGNLRRFVDTGRNKYERLFIVNLESGSED